MLTKWNPFELSETRSGSALSLFDGLFKDPFFRDFAVAPAAAASVFAPAADVVETEDAILVKVDLPGHDPKDVQVKLEGDTLTIQAERREEKDARGQRALRTERTWGVFARSFVLPTSVDSQRAEARYDNGVLTVSLAKRDEAKARSIQVQVK